MLVPRIYRLRIVISPKNSELVLRLTPDIQRKSLVPYCIAEGAGALPAEGAGALPAEGAGALPAEGCAASDRVDTCGNLASSRFHASREGAAWSARRCSVERT